MDIKLGKYVQCLAYLKRISDGVFIEQVKKGEKWCGFIAKEDCYIPHWKDWNDSLMPEGFAPFVDINNFQVQNIPEELLSPCDGSDDALKTYYKTVAKDFGGYVVAIKDVVVDAYLSVDTYYTYSGGERYKIDKRPNTTIKCAVVYYALGKSRLVPLENIKELKE